MPEKAAFTPNHNLSLIAKGLARWKGLSMGGLRPEEARPALQFPRKSEIFPISTKKRTVYLKSRMEISSVQKA